jgi:UDP-3-O-[3-hydroxymyristoyl] glucosamine N-acyltransferase
MAASALSLAELNAAVQRASAGRLAATIEGSADTRVAAVAPLAAAGPRDLGFFANPRYRTDLMQTRAAAVVLSAAHARELSVATVGHPALVIVEQPYAWFALAAQILHPEPPFASGTALGATVSPLAHVDASAAIEPGAVIGARASIGPGVRVGAGCIVGDDVVLGQRTRLFPRAVVLDRCKLGARCVVHSGAVIGADGFGFAPLDGRWIKIPQVGAVVIGDDVEIGANTTVDRGTMGDTVIEDGVKLDNQIQVAHNCVIGAHTVIAGCVGIAGSAKIGRNCQIGGAAMIAGHIQIADGCAIGPGTLVASSIAEPGHYTGFFPLMKNRDWERAAALIRQLDDLRDRLRQLERQRQGTTP